MRQPRVKSLDPLAARDSGQPAASAVTPSEWIIVAPRADADAVDCILKRATQDGVRNYRVLWSDGGPIRFYSSPQELWRDVFSS